MKRRLYMFLLLAVLLGSTGCMINAKINRDGVTFGASGLVPLPERWKDKINGAMGITYEDDQRELDGGT